MKHATRLQRWEAAIWLVLLLGLCVVLSWHPLTGFMDTWAHAAVGCWIWQHHQVPHHTLFLWSVPPSQPWIAHSWLSQLCFYGLMEVGGEEFGPAVFIGFTMLMVAASFALLWRLWTQSARPTMLTALLFALGIWCSAPRFYPRPELFTALFLVVVLGFLSVRPHLNARSMIGMVALIVLWSNLHGAVSIGLLLLAITIICELLQERGSKPSLALAGLGLACLLAVNLNPYGVHLWEALKPISSATFATIQEWQPFWKAPALPITYVVGEAVLCLFALGAWLANPQRRWSQVIWLLVMAASFIEARRFQWLLALIALVVLAANAQSLDIERWSSACTRWRGRIMRGRISGVSRVSSLISELRSGAGWVGRTAVLFVLLDGIFNGFPGNDSTPLHTVDDTTPVDVATWLRQHPMPGHLFNDYEYSSYLQWGCGGNPPLYIDLLNAYPDAVMTDYVDIIHATRRGIRLLDERHITRVFLRPHAGEGLKHGVGRLSVYLDAHWKRVYFWEDGSIWVRLRPGEKPARQITLPRF